MGVIDPKSAAITFTNCLKSQFMLNEEIYSYLVSRWQNKNKNLLVVYHQEHPWAGEDLSLKIDERDQTIWICILEL